MPIVEYHSRAEWLRARRKSIGASESPAILGVGYADQSPVSVYASKIADATEPREPDDRLVIGSLIEPALREIFRWKTNLDVSRSAAEYVTYYHDRIPWLSATPDAMARSYGESVPVELKNVDGSNRDEWRDGEYPLMYAVQVQHQLAVTGASHGYLMGLVGGNDPQVRRIDRNDAFIDAMIDHLANFWVCVETREPPPADGSEATARALATLWPRDDGSVVCLPDEAAEWAEKLHHAKETLKTIEGIKTEMENRLRAAIGEHAYGRLPDGSGFSWKAQDRAGYIVEPTTCRVLRRVKKVP